MGILKVPRILSWAGKVPTGYYAPTGIPCLGRRVTAGDAQQKKKKKVVQEPCIKEKIKFHDLSSCCCAMSKEHYYALWAYFKQNQTCYELKLLDPV